MSISGALSNAMSGLAAAGRATDVIAQNVSNANTPGYARRAIELSATSANLVGGVTVGGVNRNADPVLIGARREAESDLGYASRISNFLNRLEDDIGLPDKDNSISNLIANFDARLLEASSRPDATERLESSVIAAKELIGALNDTSRNISKARSEADSDISAQVSRLNNALLEVKELNSEITKLRVKGGDDSSLQDIRQRVIDEINEMVPVRLATRDSGAVALYSTGGVALLDGTARTIEFTPVNLVTPYMSLSGGQLSGLSAGGVTIRTNTANSDIPGGTLSAAFAIRDELAPDAMAQIDAAARDLVERFQDPAVDPTLAPGDAGLFTDGGGAFLPADEVGLAERLSLNTAVDPVAGGEVWRLRDGLGAATPGAVGQAALLDTLRSTLASDRVPASGDFGTGALSFAGLSNTLLSRVGVQRLSADQSLTFSNAVFNEMLQAERAAGVDTDAELQQLILFEQAYTANARMIQTIDDMFDTLLRIGA